MGAAAMARSVGRALAPDADAAATKRRVARLVAEYGTQGVHRTATSVDRASGDWLAAQVREAGQAPAQEVFPIGRIDLATCAIVCGGRRVEGVPLFDGSFTDASGIRGRLGGPTSAADVLLTETAVNGAGAGPLGEARRAGRHRAIVAVTRGRRPGLCPSNADDFLRPFGPPVVQVSSTEADWLGGQAARGAEIDVIAHVTRTAATASNVIARVEGAKPGLPPLVVMTPRSGWYSCASERGGGIACWLEVMRALGTRRPDRPVWFVASSGHELGHLGIDAFIERRPGIVPEAVAWLHLGANIGAAVEPGNSLQASDDGLDGMLTRAMAAVGLAVDRRTPRGRRPSGEAEAVHRGGGRFLSVIGSNAWFHNPEDRGPHVIDPVVIAKFSTAFVDVVRELARAA
jgi:hypothetical protein